MSRLLAALTVVVVGVGSNATTGAEEKPKLEADVQSILLCVLIEEKVIIGEEVFSIPRAKLYMCDRYEIDKKQTSPAEWEKGKGRSKVVIFAAEETPFKIIHDVMVAVRQAGYREVTLRLPSKQVTPPVKQPPLPKQALPEQENGEPLTIQVYAGEKGIGRIIVSLPEGDVEAKDLADLGKLLVEIRKKTKLAPSVRLEVADKVTYRGLIEAIELTKKAGFPNVSPMLLGGKRK